MGKAIGYFRVPGSGGPVGQGGDPEQTIRHWCSSHQHQVAAVHSDRGAATDGLDSALGAAVDAALLVVDTVESLAAAGGSAQSVYKRLKSAGTRLVVLKEHLDDRADPQAVLRALGVSDGAGPDVRITFSPADDDAEQASAGGGYALPEMDGDEVADEYAVPTLSLDDLDGELSAEELAELAPAPTFGDEQEAGVVPADDNEAVGVWSLDDEGDEEASDSDADEPKLSIATDQDDIDALLASRADSVNSAAAAGTKPAEQGDIDFLMAMHAGRPAAEPKAAAPAAPQPAAAPPQEPAPAMPEPPATPPSAMEMAPPAGMPGEVPAADPGAISLDLSPADGSGNTPAQAAAPPAAEETDLNLDEDTGNGTFPPTFNDDGKTTVPTPAQQTDIDFLVAMHGARRNVPAPLNPAANKAPASKPADDFSLPPSTAAPLGVAPADAPPLGGTPLEGDPAPSGETGVDAPASGYDLTVPPSAAPPLGGVSTAPATPGERVIYPVDDDYGYQVPPRRPQGSAPVESAPEPAASDTEGGMDLVIDNPFEDLAREMAGDATMQMARELTGGFGDDATLEAAPEQGNREESVEEDARRSMTIPPPPPGVPQRNLSRPRGDLFQAGQLREAPKSYSPLAPISGMETEQPAPPAPSAPAEFSADALAAEAPVAGAPEAGMPATDTPDTAGAPAEFSADALSVDTPAATPAGEPPMADFLELGGTAEAQAVQPPATPAEQPPVAVTPEPSAPTGMTLPESDPMAFGAPPVPDPATEPAEAHDQGSDGVQLKPLQSGTGRMVHGELEGQVPKTVTPVGMFGKAVRDDDDTGPDSDMEGVQLKPFQSGTGHMVHGELEGQIPKTITPVGSFAKAVRDDDGIEPDLSVGMEEDEIPVGLMSDEPAGPPQPVLAGAPSGDDPGLDVAGAIARARAELLGYTGVPTGLENSRPADWPASMSGGGMASVQAPAAPPVAVPPHAGGASPAGGPAAWDRRARVGHVPASVSGANVVDLSQSREMAELSRLRRHSDYIPVAEAASQQVARGHFARAVEMWQKFLPSAEGHNRGMAMNAIGDVYVRTGDVATATAHFEQAIRSFEESGYYTKAVAALKKIRKLSPANAKLHLQLGELAARCGRLGDAVDAYLHYARRMVDKGDVFAARGIFDRIRILDPINARHRLQLAAELQDFGFLDEAVAEIINAADILMAQGRQEEAQRHLTRMMDAAPGNAPLQKALERVAAGQVPVEPEAPLEDGLCPTNTDLEGDDGSFWHRPLETDGGPPA
ncbi:MAG: hypothetical protein OEY97_08970 [Nitrospirota bacterium]|nr:hypothetical protein [Nitrospirota bacterium]